MAAGLEPKQRMLAAIFVFVITLWITEAVPIPVTAMLGLVLCVLLGVGTEDEVFPAFADGTIFLFVGAFILAEAMMKHGLDRRFAFRILSARGVAESTHRTIVGFGVVALAISAFIFNTADPGPGRGVRRLVRLHAPTAIVYGSGMIPITRMIRSGFVFDIIGLVLIVTGITLMAQVLGFV